MSLKIIIILFLFVSQLFFSCAEPDRTNKLQSREEAVQQKEQQLLNLEQQLQFKEQELAKRERILDSLGGGADSIGTYNPVLAGNWLITMQCTEATCEGYAVGDTKTERWNISYHNNKVIVNATVNSKTVRSYSGLFNDNSLTLKAVLPPHEETEMNVILNPHPANSNLMEGERIINKAGNCKVVFSLKAEKQ